MIPERADIPKVHQWNVEAMYHHPEEWLKHYEEFRGQKNLPRWPQLEQFKGKLHVSPELLSEALTIYFDIDRVLSKLYTC